MSKVFRHGRVKAELHSNRTVVFTVERMENPNREFYIAQDIENCPDINIGTDQLMEYATEGLSMSMEIVKAQVKAEVI